MTGPLTRPIVAFTRATSSAVVLRPYCAAMHSYPSACRGTINLLKQEPSAQSPWQNTILGLEGLGVISKSPYRETTPNGVGNRSTDCLWVHSERPEDDTPLGGPGRNGRWPPSRSGS